VPQLRWARGQSWLLQLHPLLRSTAGGPCDPASLAAGQSRFTWASPTARF